MTRQPPVKANQFAQMASALDRMGFTRTHKLIILLVAFGALFDAIEQFNVGYAGPALRDLWALSGSQIGLLSTATFGGLTVGCLAAGVAGDKIGRRATYMYNLGLYTGGALVCAFAPNLTVLLIGRFLVGIGLGGELNTGVTLVSELVPTRNRGQSVAVVNIAAGGFGIFASAALAWLILGPLGGMLGGEATSWRWLLGVLAAPAVLVFIYRRYLPESPRYLVSKGRIAEANQVLSHLASGKLNGRNVAVREYVSSHGQAAGQERVRLGEIFSRDLRARTAVIWVISWMTFGAQVTINIFMPTVLVAQGYEIVKSIAFSMVINGGGMVGAFAASYLGGRARRKIVLGYGAIAAVVIAFAFAYSSGIAMIIALGALLQMMFMILNTTTWIWAPELYPTRVRAFGTGAAVTVAQLSGTLTPFAAGALFDSFGKTGMFLMVSVMYVVMAITAYYGRETFGQSLEAISEGEAISDGLASDETTVGMGLHDQGATDLRHNKFAADEI